MNKIKAILMIEIMGKPAEHVKQALAGVIEGIGKAKDVELREKKLAEPKEIEDGIFTSFAEIEIEATLQSLMLLCFEFMPSHVDIVSPEELRGANTDFNLFFNEFIRKLHQYDELARTMLMERDILINQIKQIKEHPELLQKVKVEENLEDSLSEPKKKNPGKKKKNSE